MEGIGDEGKGVDGITCIQLVSHSSLNQGVIHTSNEFKQKEGRIDQQQDDDPVGFGETHDCARSARSND